MIWLDRQILQRNCKHRWTFWKGRVWRQAWAEALRAECLSPLSADLNLSDVSDQCASQICVWGFGNGCVRMHSTPVRSKNLSAVPTGSNTMALLERLEPGNVYLVKISASNQVGDGPFSTTVELALGPGSRHRGKSPRHSGSGSSSDTTG